MGDSQASETVQGLVIMGVWVRAGMLRAVSDSEKNMEKVAGHVLKAGLVVEPAA